MSNQPPPQSSSLDASSHEKGLEGQHRGGQYLSASSNRVYNDQEAFRVEADIRNGNPGPGSEHTLRSWKVLTGSLFLTIPTYGLMSAIGLFQTYLQEHQLAAESATKISWLLSVFGFLNCFMCVAAGALFDRFKPHYYLPFGSLAYAISFLGLGWASTYAQFLGCFAVGGVFNSVPAVVAFGVVDHWFREHHAFAIGFVTLGAPVGGIFFSVVLQVLFDKLDWKDAMVALSCILVGFLLIGNMLVEAKETKNSDASLRRSLWSGCSSGWTFLRSRKFFLFTYSVFVFEFVLYAQWGSLPAYAVFLGLGNQFYIQMTYNIGAIFARTAPPYLATLWGPFNVTIMTILFTVLVMFTVWIPSGDHSAPALYTVAFLIGFGTGSFTPLSASCISELCERRGYGKWIGGCYTLASFANLISLPISQAILETRGPRYLVAALGVILMSASCSCLAARWLKLGGKWTIKIKV